MDLENLEHLNTFLEQFVLEDRIAKFRAALEQRTTHLTIVLEDIYQSQNASAVLRSAECFGIQDVHIIENQNQFDVNPDIVMGASKWLSLHKYNEQESNTESCLMALKQKGYRLIATSPRPGGISLEELHVDSKTALLFGNELQGLSAKALEMADQYMFIPMMGFTESLNISVSAALCLHHLSRKLRSTDVDWQLSKYQYQELLLDWMKKTLRNPDALINYFRKTNSVV